MTVTPKMLARLRRAVKTNDNLARECRERQAHRAAAYAEGSAFGFRQAIRIIKGEAA